MRYQRIHIELTNNCNFACEFCPSSLMTREKGSMDFGLFCNIINEISHEELGGIINLHLMGEPLLYPRLSEAVAYTKTNGLKVNLITNGSLMTDVLLERLLDAGIDQITFSVQTPDRRSFESRKANCDFDEWMRKICSSIAQIISHRGITKARLSLMTIPLQRGLCLCGRENIIGSREDLFKHMHSWLKSISASFSNEKEKVNFYCKIKELDSYKKKIKLLAQNQIKITDNFEIATWIQKKWVHAGLFSRKIHKARFGYCGGLIEQFGILWNGDMVFCCYDFDGKTVFSNVAKKSIKASLEEEEINDFVNNFRHYRIRHSYCQRCLGDCSFWLAVLRQCSSIIYFKYFRKYRTKKYSVP